MASVTAQRETEMYERQRQAAQPLSGQCPLALVPGYIVGPSSYRNLPGCDSVAACCALCSQDRACAAFTYDRVEYCREAETDTERQTHTETDTERHTRARAHAHTVKEGGERDSCALTLGLTGHADTSRAVTNAS